MAEGTQAPPPGYEETQKPENQQGTTVTQQAIPQQPAIIPQQQPVAAIYPQQPTTVVYNPPQPAIYNPPQQVYLGQQPVVQPVPGYVYPQQQVVPGTIPVQQVQYVVPGGAVVPQAGVSQRPIYGAPNTYLVVTIVVMIICALLNITSIAFGIPALIMAILAQERLSAGDYHTASQKGMAAMVLNICNVGYTLLWGVIVTGAIVGTYCAGSEYYYYNDYC